MSPPTIVLITGANQGIGYQVAKQLLALPNYYVLLGSRDPAAGAAAASSLDPTGKSIEPIILDVTDDASIERATAYISQTFGSLDTLINNAGINAELGHYRLHSESPLGENETQITYPSGPALRTILKETYDVNVFGAAALTEACIPLLEQSQSQFGEESRTKTPKIVFVSSRTGSLGLADTGGPEGSAAFRSPRFPVYRSSKAAVNMVMLHFARRFESRNWKVNASCPNLTATRLSSGMGRDPAESARNVVELATLGSDGPTGIYCDDQGGVPW